MTIRAWPVDRMQCHGIDIEPLVSSQATCTVNIVQLMKYNINAHKKAQYDIGGECMGLNDAYNFISTRVKLPLVFMMCWHQLR